MTTHPDSPWNAERDAELRTLWASGLSASKIGGRVGLGKNSVIGRVQRLKLPGRLIQRSQALSPKPERIAVEKPSIPAVAPTHAPFRNASGQVIWTADLDARMRALVAAGHSLSMVAKGLGVAYDTARHRAKKLGLLTNPSSQRNPALDATVGTRFGQREISAIIPANPARGVHKTKWVMLCDCGRTQPVRATSVAAPDGAKMCPSCAAKVKVKASTAMASRFQSGTDWTTLEPRLREMHAAGHSDAEIARDLGVTEAAVHSRTMHLKLGKRGMPVAATSVLTASAFLAARQTAPVAEQPPVSAVPFSPRIVPDYRIGLPIPPPRSCDWVATDHRPHRKCGDPTVPGKPYCDAHCLRAYRRIAVVAASEQAA